MFLQQAHEAKPSQLGRGDGGVHVARTSIPPRPTTVQSGSARAVQVKPPPTQLADARAWPFPLAPENAAQFPTDPLVDILEAAFHLG